MYLCVVLLSNQVLSNKQVLSERLGNKIRRKTVDYTSEVVDQKDNVERYK